MSGKNLQDYAVELANEALWDYEFINVTESCEELTNDECNRVHDLITAKVKAHIPTEPKIISTPEELETLERDDADAVVLASEAGAVRTVRALAAMRRLGSAWGLPAVVVATGAQVRAAREAMEIRDGLHD